MPFDPFRVHPTDGDDLLRGLSGGRRPVRAGAPRWLMWTMTAIVLFLLVREIRPWFQPLHDPDATPREVAPRGALLSEEEATIALFRAGRQSVVHIHTTERVRSSRHLFGVAEVPRGQGSGFVWSDDGYIVTNYHVLDGAQRAYVSFENGGTYEGFFVGGSPDHDLAVLRIHRPKEELRPVTVGTSKDLQVGQKVLAIGNPFGLGWTLTTGVVSGLDRSILSVSQTPIDGVIQTDAAINPGNSGGPLFDSSGRLIGVNTAIYSPSGASVGIGFAVPVDTVNWVVPQVMQRGKPERAGLGVLLLSDAEARRAGLTGAVVADVSPGSAAARAGLRGLSESSGTVDVIEAIDGESVRSREDLLRKLGTRDVGQEVELQVRRGDERLDVRATLQDVR
jgi:S1-C subfamily serine protease